MLEAGHGDPVGVGEELGLPVRNASLLIRSMRFMLEKWPRLVAEYKPAFGSVFEQYLGTEYTHWGYCDLDMVIGTLRPGSNRRQDGARSCCSRGGHAAWLL